MCQPAWVEALSKFPMYRAAKCMEPTLGNNRQRDGLLRNLFPIHCDFGSTKKVLLVVFRITHNYVATNRCYKQYERK